jgi:hypothetical protein
MIKGSEIRKADFPIEPLLLDRWSPRAMSGEEISQEELMRQMPPTNVRRGPLIGFKYKDVDLTTYWLRPGSSEATLVFAVTVRF